MELVFSYQMIDVTSQRFERKYSFSVSDLEILWRWKCGQGTAFQVTYPNRLINNIYFESPEWENYDENLSGISHRCKCRLRWYGNNRFPVEMRFEVKRRQNAIGDKLVQRISRDQLDLVKGSNNIYRELRKCLDPELRLILDQSHRPLLFNRYNRHYYSTKDGVRLTVDTNLQFESLSISPLEDTRRTVKSEIFGFIEVKYSTDQRSLVEYYLSQLPFRATRNSKYVIGLQHLYR